jgi:hypothetical protein
MQTTDTSVRLACEEAPPDCGYASADYAQSLAHLGDPLWLPNAEGWLLRRQIPGTERWDAIGCYPLFSCRRWERLEPDLARLSDLVSVTVVVDPLSAERAGNALASAFPDLAAPYKQHFLVDLQSNWADGISPKHRRTVEVALPQVVVQRCSEPVAELAGWCDLYGGLKRKREIAIVADFPRESFARQLRVPGLVIFKACQGTETVAMHLWFVQGLIAYYHLSASNDEGYRLHASFALMWSALQEFQHMGLHWAALGGSPDAPVNGQDGGLARFKKRWATCERPAYLCGRVCDPAAYDQLTVQRNHSSFFPAYRSPPAAEVG